MIIKHQDARKSIFKEHTKPNKNGINSISFENIEYNNTNTILFKVRRNGYEYIEVKYNDLKKLIKIIIYMKLLPKIQIVNYFLI